MFLLERIERILAAHFTESARRRCLERSLGHALKAFESEHGRWQDALFDHHFLRHRGAEALRAGDAEGLARAWTQQFAYRDEARRERDVRHCLTAARSFLTLLERAARGCTGETQQGQNYGLHSADQPQGLMNLSDQRHETT